MVASLVLSALLSAPAGAAVPVVPPPGRELAGGTAEVQLNEHLLGDLGIRASGPAGRGEPAALTWWLFDIGSVHPALILAGESAVFEGLAGGSLWLEGRLELSWGGGGLRLSAFELVPGTAAGALFDVRTPDGLRPFYLDSPHPRYRADTGEYSFLNMDLKVASALAGRLGRPELEGLVVGAAHVRTRLIGPARGVARGACVPDDTGDVDVELIAIGGLAPVYHDAQAVAMAPSATLRNVGTVDVDWYRAIEPDGGGDPALVGPHPFLSNHLYRLADGALQQIGQADVKHAFFAANTGPACTCPGDQILRVDCEDLYSSFTNWNRKYLAPREEVTAASGEWTRLGSHFDGVPVNDFRDHDAGDHADMFEHRLTATVADLTVPGARYFVESWYVARGDVDIFNSVGYREVVPTFNGDDWSFPFAAGDTLTLGPALDVFVDPVSPPAGAAATVVDSCTTPPDDCDGHLQVSAKATLAPNGLYRYDYGVMNLDFDPQVDSFSVPLPAGIEVTNVSFHDGDGDPGNDWIPTVGASAISWDLPGGATAGLDWGTLHHFRFEANAASTDVTVALGVFETRARGSGLMAASKGPEASLFAVNDLDVALQGTGSGVVTSAPVGIDCGADCAEVYAQGTAIVLTAAADPGNKFVEWTEGGVPAGTATDLNLTLTSERTLVAEFEACEKTLGSETVTGAEVFEACELLRTGPLFVVQPGGAATLRAGSTVVLADGLSIEEGGSLTAEIDPALLP